MDLGSLLVGTGASAILLALVQAVINRRKLGADTVAVLSETARELVQPLRERIQELQTEEKKLRRRVESLEEDLRWLRNDRADQVRRDRLMHQHGRAMVAWAHLWVPQARALGLEVPDPPEPPELPPLLEPQIFGPPARREYDPDPAHWTATPNPGG